jgi:ribonucleoside-triphosphate reductase
VREDEWLEVGAFVYRHFDRMSGVSFLPHSDHSYQQAPYQDCTQEEYEALSEQMPDSLTWDSLAAFEVEDSTTGSHELACSAGVCEIA